MLRVAHTLRCCLPVLLIVMFKFSLEVELSRCIIGWSRHVNSFIPKVMRRSTHHIIFTVTKHHVLLLKYLILWCLRPIRFSCQSKKLPSAIMPVSLRNGFRYCSWRVLFMCHELSSRQCSFLMRLRLQRNWSSAYWIFNHSLALGTLNIAHLDVF